MLSFGACEVRCWRWLFGKKIQVSLSCCLGFRVQGLGFRVSGFEFRVSGFGFRVSGFGFRVSGFWFRVSGFGFRVSGFGFLVSGFGFRVSGSKSWKPGRVRGLARAGSLPSSHSGTERRRGLDPTRARRRARFGTRTRPRAPRHLQREFFIDNLLVRIHFIIVMIRWTGFAPWEGICTPGSSGVSAKDRRPNQCRNLKPQPETVNPTGVPHS